MCAMRIGDVERLTGLSRKTIRLYEEKGLLSVVRSENSYREYDDAIVAKLRTIAVLRRAGVPLMDIQLWQDGVISAEEMLQKQISALKNTADQTVGQKRLCMKLLEYAGDGTLCIPTELLAMDDDTDGTEAASETEEAASEVLSFTDQPCSVGIDIGTTTVCAYVLRLSDGVPVGIYNIRNASDLPAQFAGDKRQDAALLYDRVHRLIDALLRRYPTICTIGFTGQMHGILCTDEAGQALTPLFTWQDQRAGLGEESAVAAIARLTGCRVAAGYGLATVYALLCKGELPARTVRICTVMDYVAARLCGVSVSIMHTTNAASLGLFDRQNSAFDKSALAALGIRPEILPDVTDAPAVIGCFRGIPVTVPIGDNQASFLGAMRNPGTSALANFGTGSQISMLADSSVRMKDGGAVEIRPFLEGKCLLSGSALCGGRAYAMLEQFFRAYAVASGQEDKEQYAVLNRLAAESLDTDQIGGALRVKTTFCGTRDNPEETGAVLGIKEELFTPGALAAGVLRGMAEELYSMYETMPHGHIKELIASGNAIRRNPVLRRALSEVFGVPVLVPIEQEEAAFGAAMIAAVGAGFAESTAALSEWVRYRA